jgi:hypothetical protein
MKKKVDSKLFGRFGKSTNNLTNSFNINSGRLKINPASTRYHIMVFIAKGSCTFK